jgi:hypothetical protein
LALTAGELLFVNVKQNIITKRAIENRQNKPIQTLAATCQHKPRLRSADKAEKIAIAEQLPLKLMSAGTAPYKLFKKIIRRNVHGYVFIYKFCRAVYYIISAKHLSKAWRATVRLGDVVVFENRQPVTAAY